MDTPYIEPIPESPDTQIADAIATTERNALAAIESAITVDQQLADIKQLATDLLAQASALAKVDALIAATAEQSANLSLVLAKLDALTLPPITPIIIETPEPEPEPETPPESTEEIVNPVPGEPIQPESSVTIDPQPSPRMKSRRFNKYSRR